MNQGYIGPGIPSPVPVESDSVQRLAYTVEEAAEAMGISRRSMYNLINREGFPTLKVGGRRLISVELLAEWVRAQAGGGD